MSDRERLGFGWIARLLGWVLLAVAVGGVSGLLTAGAIESWYSTIVKPSFTPPDRLFGPVWSLLYVLMGVAIFLARRAGRLRGESALTRRATVAFLVQLALNGLWSLLFFGLQSPALALVEIALLWLAIGWTIARFRPISGPAAALLLPYWAWVSFAALLNASIWWLNR